MLKYGKNYSNIFRDMVYSLLNIKLRRVITLLFLDFNNQFILAVKEHEQQCGTESKKENIRVRFGSSLHHVSMAVQTRFLRPCQIMRDFKT
jgi:hypothetical protein